MKMRREDRARLLRLAASKIESRSLEGLSDDYLAWLADDAPSDESWAACILAEAR